MKNIKITLSLIIVVFLSSCSQEKLPNELLNDNIGYEKLTNYIYSHYKNLEKEGIEVLEFSYSGSIHPQRDEVSSDLIIKFVKGSNKNRIVEYNVNNEGRLANNNVDISVGGITDKKLSNSYETYKPFLFTDKQINLDILRQIKDKAIEEFKKETNVEKAYCKSISIKKENNQEPTIYVRIEQRKFVSDIKRSTYWSLDGKKIK